MSSLAELFASVGFKVDEASIKKYDAALEASKAKTKVLDERSQALLKRMADLDSARDREAAQVKAFIKLQEELQGKQETDQEKKASVAKAMGVVGFATKKTGEELSASERKAKDWAKTVVALEAGLNLASSAFGFVRGKIQGMLGDIGAAGGKAGSVAALSTRVGLTTDALQELGYAAEQNAGSMEGLANGWKAFANKADSAAKGGKEAAKAFRAVGVSAKDLRSGKLGLDEALGKVADKFQKMEDGPKKAALAMDLFGGAGGALIPLLNQGSKGIAALREEARKLGVVISADGIKSLAGFDDQMAKFRTTTNALRTQALAAIIPTLSKVLEKFQAWLGENREAAVAALTASFKILVEVISKVADGVTMLTPIIKLVAENIDLVTAAIGGAIVGFAAYKIAAVAASVGSVAAALTAAAAWALANWPFVALGLAVAGIMHWWPEIVDAVRAAFGFIADNALRVGKFLLNFIPIAAIIMHWSKIKAGAQAVGRGIRDVFIAVKDAVISTFTKAYDWVTGKIEGIRKRWREFKDNFAMGPSDTERKAAVAAAGDTGFNFIQRQQQERSISVPSSSAPSSRSTTIQNNIPINVVSNSADPKAVAVAVRTEFQGLWNSEMRKADG
ncbi:MAG: hypothetical protein ACRCU1_00455 [Alsobacter sp.]